MAVKVVNPTPDPSVVRRTVCRNCGTGLEYVPADVKQRKVSDYLGDVDVVHYIECPCCWHQVSVQV